MKIGPDTKIKELIDAYPFVKEFLGRYNPHFKSLENPVLWKTVGRFATLSRAAVMGGSPLPEMLKAIAAEIQAKTGESVPIAGEKDAAVSREEQLKGIIRDLHATENVGPPRSASASSSRTWRPGRSGRWSRASWRRGSPRAR